MPGECNALFWNWIPLRSIGPIVFGQSLRPLVLKYKLRKLPPACDSAEWETYEFPDSSVEVYVEHGSVDRVACFEEMFFEGRDLLRLTDLEVTEIFGEPDEIGEPIDGLTPLEFEKYELTLWLAGIHVDSAYVAGRLLDPEAADPT